MIASVVRSLLRTAVVGTVKNVVVVTGGRAAFALLHRPGRRESGGLLLPMLLMLALATPVQATTCTWTGLGTDSNWSNSANWNNCGGAHALPVDGDTLAFPDGVPRLANNNDGVKLKLAQLLIGGVVDITGNTIGLSAGITVDIQAVHAGSPTLELNLVLETNPQTFQCSGAKGLVVSGNVNLNGHALTVDGTCGAVFSGDITGAGGIIKNGSSSMSLQGANTYTGTTVVNAGNLNDDSSLGAIGIGNETFVNGGGTLTLQSGAAPIASETLVLAGTGSGNIGALRVPSGTDVTIDAPVSLTADATVNVSGTGTLTLTNECLGSSILSKIGTGLLRLDGDSSNEPQVLAGTVEANGSVGGAEAGGGGILAGDGVSTATVTALPGGYFAPGRTASARPGTFTATKAAWDGGGIMAFQLGASSAQSDHLDVLGLLGKAGSGSYSFEFSDASSPPTAGVIYTLITVGSTGFNAGDLTFSYLGTGPGASMDGTFEVTDTEIRFTPSSVVSDLVYRDGME